MTFVERRGLKRFQARTYLNYSTCVPRLDQPRCGPAPNWCVLLSTPQPRTAISSCAAYCRTHLIAFLFFAGDPLSEVQQEAQHGLVFAQEA